jgi:putative membrane protein
MPVVGVEGRLDSVNEIETAAAGFGQDWRAPAAQADPRVELAAVRTGLAFERTRMSADRTLMAVMRTSLGLIGIGFAVFEYFRATGEMPGTGSSFSSAPARNVGFALVGLGLGVLGPSILAHRLFLRRLRQRCDELARRGLLPPELDLPGSLPTTLAVLLFAVGVIAILRMVMHSGLPG